MSTNKMPYMRESSNPLSEFRRDFDRFFDDWFSSPSHHYYQNESSYYPVCDVDEQDDHYCLAMDIPGVKKEDLRLEVVDNQLIIHGERRHDSQQKEGSYNYSERRYGKFQRAFTLPAGVDLNKVEASYQDGILKMIFPKAETSKPRQINITSGSNFYGNWMGHSNKEDQTMKQNQMKKEDQYSEKREDQYSPRREEQYSGQREDHTKREAQYKRDDMYNKRNEQYSGKREENEYTNNRNNQYSGKSENKEYPNNRNDQYSGKREDTEYSNKRNDQYSGKREDEYNKRNDQYPNKREDEHTKRNDQYSGKDQFKKDDQYSNKNNKAS